MLLQTERINISCVLLIIIVKQIEYHKQKAVNSIARHRRKVVFVKLWKNSNRIADK